MNGTGQTSPRGGLQSGKRDFQLMQTTFVWVLQMASGKIIDVERLIPSFVNLNAQA